MAGVGDGKAPLNVAVFGCGKMGLHHARAIQASRGGRLVAVADPAVDAAKLAPTLPKDVRVFTSATDLLKTVKPDVVHIVTPPGTHADLAKLCLEHGAHVYVEKPFTLRTAEADAVLDAAGRAGRSVCAGHQLLFEAPARALTASLPLIGRVVHVESYFSFRTVRQSRDGRALLSPIEQLLDILPHPVYTLLAALRASDPDAAPDVVSLSVRPEGEVHAVLRAGGSTGVLVVTLRGRPIESYLRVVGTNGCLRADFVRGALIALPGPGTSAISIVSNPYREATQILVGSTRGFASRLLHAGKGYPGLVELTDAFYDSIRHGAPPPFSPSAIRETVRVCERVGDALREAEKERERQAEHALIARERELPPIDSTRGAVLVTGGAGMLGRAVVSELRGRGWKVRAVGRRVPPPSAREAGVEYTAADLSQDVDGALFDGVSTVVHCAAETAGGKEAHERNTILATRNLLRSAAKQSIKRFVYVSSLAVLKPGKSARGLLDERTPVDAGNLSRGPYVWGKAEAEREVLEQGPLLGVGVRVLRPGPLVDFTAYEPPGRLGRELGPRFVAVGSRLSRISLCAVHTAAQVIRVTVEEFDSTPPVVNLVEPTAPTRKELLDLWLKQRPDLKAIWLSSWVLAILSPVAVLLQRIIRPKATPVDLAAAFSSERYDATLAAQLINRAKATSGSKSI
jgi:predicted dehydrogenase/nucleoside-diphosphate-sugar epimerase